MSIFDVYIERVAEYVAARASAGDHIRVMEAPSAVAELKRALIVRVGPGANPGIILRDDMHMELGNPEVGSCSFLLLTDQPELVCDGRITVVGPDIAESGGRSLPFGQVLIVGGSGLDVRMHEALLQMGIIGDQVEGYMLRSLPQSAWARVGRDAASRGFSFATLGQALMAIYRAGEPRVMAMEALFVTASRAALQPLLALAAQVEKIAREIVRENWKIKGYDIDCVSDCSRCPDKVVCDDIKDTLAVKKEFDHV